MFNSSIQNTLSFPGQFYKSLGIFITMQNSPDYGRSHGAIFFIFIQDVFMKRVVAIIDD